MRKCICSSRAAALVAPSNRDFPCKPQASLHALKLCDLFLCSSSPAIRILTCFKCLLRFLLLVLGSVLVAPPMAVLFMAAPLRAVGQATSQRPRAGGAAGTDRQGQTRAGGGAPSGQQPRGAVAAAHASSPCLALLQFLPLPNVLLVPLHKHVFLLPHTARRSVVVAQQACAA